jgi:N-acetylneuraminic acid mutarotase
MQLIKPFMKIFTMALAFMVVFALQLNLTSCNSTASTTTLPGSWDKVGDFNGIPRSGAVSFVINGFAYAGTGFNYENNKRLTDFWKYDASSDSWTAVADFPGAPRSGAVSFVMNNKAYVGTGTNDGLFPLSDFYEFDPSVGTKGKWTQVADLGYDLPIDAAHQDTSKTVRYGAVAFSVNNRGFVGGGHYLSDLKDLWEYDQINNTWILRPSIGGSKRQNGFAMVIDNIAYVGGGIDNNSFTRDFYKFDVTKINPDGTGNPWTAVNSFTGKDINGNAIVQPRPRQLTSTFSIGAYGYLVCGDSGGPNGETWRYDPSKDSWIQYYSFNNNWPIAGSSRSGAVSFAIGDFGYITTGGSGTTFKFDDCWKFNPAGVEPDNK